MATNGRAGELDCLDSDDLKRRLHKTARKELDEHLVQDECALIVIEGMSAQAMIVTNRHRVLVFQKGMLSGVTFGRRMYTWDFSEIHGVRVDMRVLSGFVALETTGSDVDRLSYWGAESGDTWKAADAIPIRNSLEKQAREGAAALRALLHRYHNPQESSHARNELAASPHGSVPVQSASSDPAVTPKEPSTSVANRFCFACGARLHTGAVFCSSCGQKMD